MRVRAGVGEATAREGKELWKVGRKCGFTERWGRGEGRARSERNRRRSRRMNRGCQAPRGEGGSWRFDSSCGVIWAYRAPRWEGGSRWFSFSCGVIWACYAPRRGYRGMRHCGMGASCRAFAEYRNEARTGGRCYSGVSSAAEGVSRPDFSRAGFAAARTRERM